MVNAVVGWDVGGAHLKAVLLNGRGEVEKVSLQYCPLWKGLDYLMTAIEKVCVDLAVDKAYCKHALTMTGELVDLFDDREQGVAAIIGVMQQQFADEDMLVYAGQSGFLRVAEIDRRQYVNIASANWLASAGWIADQIDDGLFVDIGSTTTDVLLLSEGRVKAQGMTDYQRLVSGELVYTGIVRTPVMAIAQAVEFKGRLTGMMAELFATTADVYRVTGELSEAHDLSEAADGGLKTPSASAMRLSRMIGYDYQQQDFDLWRTFAERLRGLQKTQIIDACRMQLQQRSVTRLVGAGIGRFLAKEIADDLGLQYQDYNDFIKQSNAGTVINSADCAPAAAVAALAFFSSK